MIFSVVKSAGTPPVGHQAKWPQGPIDPLAVPEKNHHHKIIVIASHYHHPHPITSFAENQQGKSFCITEGDFLGYDRVVFHSP